MRSFFFTFLTLTLLGLLSSGFVASALDADAILKASKAKIQAAKDFSADFTIQMNNPAMNRPVTQTGSFMYKDGMYTLKLDGQEVYCDKNKTWVYLEEVNEVEVSDYQPDETETIESIFKLYETNSQPRYDGIENVNGAACDKIFLAVKSKDLDYNQAFLYIDQKTKLPRKVTLIDRRQTRTSYIFSKMKTNQGLTAASFQFNPKSYPGVSVIELD